MTSDAENVPAHGTNLSNSHLRRAQFVILGGLCVKPCSNETVKEQGMLSAKISKDSSVVMLLLSADFKNRKRTFQIYNSLIQSNTTMSKIIHTDLISRKSMLMRYPTASFSVFEYDTVALCTRLCVDSSVTGKQTPPSYSPQICWFLEDGSIFGSLLSRAVAGLRPRLLLPCPGSTGCPPRCRGSISSQGSPGPRPGSGDQDEVVDQDAKATAALLQRGCEWGELP